MALSGEAVNIPSTNIGLGIAFVRVWTDGNGFTSASNDLGALGYVLLETQEADIGALDPERQSIFSNLRGRVVTWDIKTKTFVKDAGLARIGMTTQVEDAGVLTLKKIEFSAENCRGISVVSNALSFSCEMLQEAKTLAELDGDQFISDDASASVVAEAPSGARPRSRFDLIQSAMRGLDSDLIVPTGASGLVCLSCM